MTTFLDLSGDPLHVILDHALYGCMIARQTCRMIHDHASQRILVKLLKSRRICEETGPSWLAETPRIPCSERGVGLGFLQALAREVPPWTTPGQLVHGHHTSGPPDGGRNTLTPTPTPTNPALPPRLA